MKKQYFTIASFLLISLIGKAQGSLSSTKVITTGVPAMQVYADPRAAGMGYLGLATSADANSGFINLSKTVFAKNKSAIAVDYTPWMASSAPGMYLACASGFYKLDDNQAISASVRYFNLGDYQLSDNNGNLLQTTRPHDMLLDFGYSRKLSKTLSLGVALRYFNSSLGTGSAGSTTLKAANGVAGDVSLFYNGQKSNGEGWTGGFAISNLGSKANYTSSPNTAEFIPANIGIGTAYTRVFNTDNKIMVGLDINKLLVPAVPTDSASLAAYYSKGVISSYGNGFSNGEWRFSIGTEYTYDSRFSLRAGYLYESHNLSYRNGFSSGVGFQYNNYHITMAYIVPNGSGVTRNPLSNTVLFGLVFDLK